MDKHISKKFNCCKSQVLEVACGAPKEARNSGGEPTDQSGVWNQARDPRLWDKQWLH